MRSQDIGDLGLVTVEHELEVPLDHADASGETITVFAREVADPDGRDKPFLVFLQGGPGVEAARPTRHPSGPSWLERALQDFRVLMVDQRGTGRSTPVGADLPGTPQEQADRLALMRADSIVRDCELLRDALGSPPWSVLGQSFGGMTALCYLSLAPDGLREVLFTGGVPAIERPIDDAYRLTFEKVGVLARRHFERYPTDAETVRALHARIEAEGPLPLVGEDRLTIRGVRVLGSRLGGDGGSAGLHHLLELPTGGPGFRHDAHDPFGGGRNPLYVLLNEATWADGTATNWAADRLEPQDPDPLRLTGEHLFRQGLEDVAELRPLLPAADLLATREWPRLYDPEVLARNPVPLAACVYTEDPYLPRELSWETAGRVRGMRIWETSEHLHSGLRTSGDRVFTRLLDMVRGRA